MMCSKLENLKQGSWVIGKNSENDTIIRQKW